MIERWHLSEDGVVRRCEAATPESCPVKGPDGEKSEHFKSQREGQQYYDTMMRQDYGVFKTMKREREPLLTLDEEVLELFENLSSIGRPLIVGGAVRDAVLGMKPSDIDIEVHETEIDEIIRRLRKEDYYVDEVGKQFGVLKVRGRGASEVDVSVPRRESKIGAGHRDFTVDLSPMTYEEAVERRDFTFNAILYDPLKDEKIDLVNGEEDLRKGVLRHVSEKFSEDPLRVLRGFQFAGRFNLRIAPETAELSKGLREEYRDLSVERVQGEWGKFYTQSESWDHGLQVLQETEWDSLEPGLDAALSEVGSMDLSQTDEREVIGASMISSKMNESDRGNFLRKTLLGVRPQKTVEVLVRSLDKDFSTPESRRRGADDRLFTFQMFHDLSMGLGSSSGVEVALKARSEGLWNEGEAPWVQGADIMALTDEKPGPWVGELLNEFREAQYSRSLQSKEEALQHLREMY